MPSKHHFNLSLTPNKKPIANSYLFFFDIEYYTKYKNVIEFFSLICDLFLFFQEEILRLRMLNDSKKDQSAAFQNPYSPPQLSQQQMPIKFIGIAIAMAIFGWILGKFLLWGDANDSGAATIVFADTNDSTTTTIK